TGDVKEIPALITALREPAVSGAEHAADGIQVYILKDASVTAAALAPHLLQRLPGGDLGRGGRFFLRGGLRFPQDREDVFQFFQHFGPVPGGGGWQFLLHLKGSGHFRWFRLRRRAGYLRW